MCHTRYCHALIDLYNREKTEPPNRKISLAMSPGLFYIQQNLAFSLEPNVTKMFDWNP